jgi:hypothetical protein
MVLEMIIVSAVGLACLFFVARPLFAPRGAGEAGAEGPKARLRREKDGLLASLREMEFDFRTGKLTEDDYQVMRSNLEAHAIDALRQLDALEAADGLDAELEDEIRALKASIAARRASGARRSV